MEPRTVIFDASHCKTHRVFGTDVYWCLASNAHPLECPYAMSFGYSFMCRHPIRNEFVETAVMKQAGM